MKKVQKTLTALVLAAVTIVSLNSCKKDENTAPSFGHATISGKITAEQDVTNTTTEAAAGVTVLITVNSKDQITNVDNSYYYNYAAGTYMYNVNYPTKVYSAVTDANGLYSVSVEVGDKALPVTVAPQDIVYNVTQVAPTAAVRTPYSVGSQNSTVYKGSNVVLDFAY